MIQDYKTFTVPFFPFHVGQRAAYVQLPAVTHRVYLDVEIDGQNIGISFFHSILFLLMSRCNLHCNSTYH